MSLHVYSYCASKLLLTNWETIEVFPIDIIPKTAILSIGIFVFFLGSIFLQKFKKFFE